MFMFASGEKSIHSGDQARAYLARAYRARTHQTRSVNKGFTLVELMITVVILSIGIALAVPTYENTMQKRRVTGAAESIAAFLSLAQGEAIKRNEVIAISVNRASDGATWCAGAMLRTAAVDHCDCTLDPLTKSGEPNFCDFNPGGAGPQRVINQVGAKKFTMNQSFSAKTGDDQDDFHFGFDPVRGIKIDNLGAVEPSIHEVTLLSTNSKYSLTVDVSVTGRISICTDSSKKVPGFDNCAVKIIGPPG